MLVLNEKLKKLLMILLLLGLATAQGAETKWYNVEIVIFSQNTPDPRTDQWPVMEGLPDWSHAETIQPGVSIPKPIQGDLSTYGQQKLEEKSGKTNQAESFSILSQSNLELNSIAESLQRSNGRFTTLLHIAWRQPGQPKKTAKAIYLQSNENNSNEMPMLQGTVRLSVQRFLHINLDLILQRKATTRLNDDGLVQSNGSGYEITGFRFKAHRRMRSKELHYLDHPKLGAIVIVQPS